MVLVVFLRNCTVVVLKQSLSSVIDTGVFAKEMMQSLGSASDWHG